MDAQTGAKEQARYIHLLDGLGVLNSNAVRRAVATVKRHRFLEAWYRVEMDQARSFLSYTEHPFDRDRPTREDLEEIYSNRSLVTAVDGRFPTSSTSQPDLVARMLELLDLCPGHSVLEIGAGTGYNAALLREMVGPDGKVCTIELKEDVAALARKHLDDEGYADVRVLARDAYHGAAEAAPFDRIVATVGCSDISPHFLSQLKPDGVMLIPLQHGFGDPLVRIERDPDAANRAIGRIVEYANFMPIEGELRWRNPWGPSIKFRPAEPPTRKYSLPESLLDTVTGEPTQEAIHRWRPYQFFLSLTAQLLRYPGLGVGIVESALKSVVLVSDDSIHGYALDGHTRSLDNLRDRLVYLAEAWDDLGRPNPEDYVLRFVPRSETPDLEGMSTHRWIVDRLDHLEIVELPR